MKQGQANMQWFVSRMWSFFISVWRLHRLCIEIHSLSITWCPSCGPVGSFQPSCVALNRTELAGKTSVSSPPTVSLSHACWLCKFSGTHAFVVSCTLCLHFLSCFSRSLRFSGQIYRIPTSNSDRKQILYRRSTVEWHEMTKIKKL